MKNTNNMFDNKKIYAHQVSDSQNAVIAEQIKRLGCIKKVSRKGAYVAWPQIDQETYKLQTQELHFVNK